MKNLNKSSKTALGGIIAAVSVVLMFLTSVIPTLTYAVPAAAGLLLLIMVIEIDKKWATVVYIAVSILSALLIADKEAATMYIAFFGYYPIVKQPIEKHLNKYISWIVKVLIFNASILAAYLLLIYVFNLSLDDFGEFTKIGLILLYLVFNVVFVIYDIALTRLITAYIYKWQKQFRKIFK
ncbi:MAG: hypothetical protein K5755_03795 [Clostridiales bacterium]|nr:hypothetical protein [Clostridia bacterium]MCR4563740.1 hypothetical protein [Clostridiales bacterium]